MLTEATGPNTNLGAAWGDVEANQNDIIEYNGANWTVSFDSIVQSTPAYVTNLTTNIQFKYTQGQWLRSYEGIYDGGNWGIVL